MSKFSFLADMARAKPEAFREVLESIYGYIEMRAFGEDYDEAAETLLFQVQETAKRRYQDDAQLGLGVKVDEVFAEILAQIEASEAPRDFRLSILLQVRRLRQVLSGNFAFESPAYAYHVVGPVVDEFPYTKISASSRAVALQKKHVISCQAYNHDNGMDRARALIFEAPLSVDEIMLAGEAKARELKVVLISDEEILPGVPTFQDADEAFRDLHARCLQSSQDVEVLGETLEQSAVLDRAPPSDGDCAALELYAGIMRQRCRNLVRTLASRSDRQAANYAEMYKMIKSDMVPEEVRTAFFEITANGSRSGESPTAAQRINGMRHQIEKLEDKIEELERPREGDGDLAPN